MATTALYLDDRVLRKDGCAPVKVVIRNRGTVAHMPMGIAVPPQCWKDGKVVLSKNKTIDAMLPAKPVALNAEILAKFSRISLLVAEICGLKSSLSAPMIKCKVTDAIEGRHAEKSVEDITLAECWDEFVESHAKEGTRKTIMIPKSYIMRAMPRAANLRLTDIDEAWAEKCAKVLKHGNERVGPLAQNTASSYLTTLKSVWHFAQKRKYVPKSEDPFAGLSIPQVATRSRALEVEDVRRIWNYDPDKEGVTYAKSKGQIVARDMFRLIICLCGINIADLYNLKETDIRGGRLETDRQKTGVHINIRLEPEAMEVIEKYKKDGYLIGRVRSGTANDTRNNINRKLKEIHPGVTTYWARHSWASLAVELDIPDRVVFMGLAHKQGKLSDETYITMRNRKLDEANRKVIDFILGKGEAE